MAFYLLRNPWVEVPAIFTISSAEEAKENEFFFDIAYKNQNIVHCFSQIESQSKKGIHSLFSLLSFREKMYGCCLIKKKTNLEDYFVDN